MSMVKKNIVDANDSQGPKTEDQSNNLDKSSNLLVPKSENVED